MYSSSITLAAVKRAVIDFGLGDTKASLPYVIELYSTLSICTGFTGNLLQLL